MTLSRRQFLELFGAAGGALLVPIASAAALDEPVQFRSLPVLPAAALIAVHVEGFLDEQFAGTAWIARPDGQIVIRWNINTFGGLFDWRPCPDGSDTIMGNFELGCSQGVQISAMVIEAGGIPTMRCCTHHPDEPPREAYVHQSSMRLNA